MVFLLGLQVQTDRLESRALDFKTEVTIILDCYYYTIYLS